MIASRIQKVEAKRRKECGERAKRKGGERTKQDRHEVRLARVLRPILQIKSRFYSFDRNARQNAFNFTSIA